MQIYPAIDIKDGQAVRLTQGDFNKSQVFFDKPEDAAENWINCGASYLHIVDLDGARSGKACIIDIIKKIKHSFPHIKLQTGGGVRRLEDIEDRLAAGADRVITGTAAVKNPEMIKLAVEKYPEKIAVGVDVKDGYAAISGWEEQSRLNAVDLCLEMKSYGINTVIYTDISKDGMMSGPNIEATKKLIEETGMDIIASGGISTMEDMENISCIGASGAIVGKALFNGALDLRELINKYERVI